MSVKLMAQVWTIVLSKGQRDVLLVMADHANDDGHCYPGNLLIAWKTDYSVRQVRRIRRSLEEAELVEVLENKGGAGNSPVCQLHLEKGVKKSPFEIWKESQKGDARASSLETGNEDTTSGISDQEKRTSSAHKGDIQGPKPGHPDVPRTIEPPENHHLSEGASSVAPDDVDVTTTSDGQLFVKVADDDKVEGTKSVAKIRRILAEIIGNDRRQLTDRWISWLGRELKRLLAEGIEEPVLIEAGKRLKAKGINPSGLDGFVIEVGNDVVSKQRSAQTSSAIEECDLCDGSGFLLAADGAPIEPIVKCIHGGQRTEGVA